MYERRSIMRNMKKFMLVLSVAGLMALTACGNEGEETTTPVIEAQPSEESTADTAQEDAATEETAQETTTEASAEAKTVEPLPTVIDLNNLGDCTVGVSFEKKDLTEENGAFQLHVMVQDYEKFDMVDISTLQVGDTLVIDGGQTKVESLEQTDTGAVKINGDIDEGGIYLWTDEDGVYYEVGFDDYKSYYEIGDITLPLSENFVFTDNSDLDNPGQTYTAEEFKNYLDADKDEIISFYPNNCKITVTGGEITAMNKEYTP